jgi:nicotinamidase-related amidase
LSFQFDERSFANARALPVIVFVDPCHHRLTNRRGLGHGEIAGVLANCRAALLHARRMGMAVAFVRDGVNPRTGSNFDWIKGFEPERSDMIFERRARSCYANPYFEEIARTSGELVLAGFPGPGGCLSIAADAVRAGTRITFLEDATFDGESARVLGAFSQVRISALTKIEIYSAGTHKWIASTKMPDRSHA